MVLLVFDKIKIKTFKAIKKIKKFKVIKKIKKFKNIKKIENIEKIKKIEKKDQDDQECQEDQECVSLAKLAVVTMDEQRNETFDTRGALDRLRKSVHLERLAFYHDSDRLPWEIHKRWEDINPNEWIEIFEEGINEANDYRRINPEIPFEKVSQPHAPENKAHDVPKAHTPDVPHMYMAHIKTHQTPRLAQSFPKLGVHMNLGQIPTSPGHKGTHLCQTQKWHGHDPGHAHA
ncbi:hypothetical protein TanjilG_08364 [Lupinus angustifolius]|uniref:Uncharacterized protein n=1 Tax=Lupinus angustifolius TaxID=3871 RepID=A0A1J7HXU3_LUPAN|nr:hypothetical protein TanjilG_08364 [Lupinus angustifolius]